jgi:hypothetical protein
MFDDESKIMRQALLEADSLILDSRSPQTGYRRWDFEGVIGHESVTGHADGSASAEQACALRREKGINLRHISFREREIDERGRLHWLMQRYTMWKLIEQGACESSPRPSDTGENDVHTNNSILGTGHKIKYDDAMQ